MTFQVELYQVLVLLVPILSVGLKFYVDVQKRQVAYEKEIFRINSRLQDLNEELRDLYKAIQDHNVKSDQNNQRLFDQITAIKIELQNKVNRAS